MLTHRSNFFRLLDTLHNFLLCVLCPYNNVQFIQFGGSLVSKSRQIYAHGGLQSNIDHEEAIRRLNGLSKGVNTSLNNLQSLGRLSENSEVLKAICERCALLGDELMVRLKGLRVDDKQKHPKWKSFRQAIKAIHSKDVVDSLAQNLAKCRDELNSHLLIAIMEKADALGLRHENAMSMLSRDTEKTIQLLIETRATL